MKIIKFHLRNLDKKNDKQWNLYIQSKSISGYIHISILVIKKEKLNKFISINF